MTDVKQESFGSTREGQAADLFTLRNDNGMIATLTNYGATLTQLHVPDRTGQLADVVLGNNQLSGSWAMSRSR